MSGMKHKAVPHKAGVQAQVYNETISLLTTSGMLDLYVLSVGASHLWVLPQSLALDRITLDAEQVKSGEIAWFEQKIPLLTFAPKAKWTHALVLEGIQDHLVYAIALTDAPDPRKIRISSLKDLEAEPEATKSSAKEQPVYQLVMHEDQTWIVPDLEQIESKLKKAS